VAARIRDAGSKADYGHAGLDGAAASRALAEQAAGLPGGRIDILVNNAGIFPGQTTLTTGQDTFDLVYSANVKSAFFLTHAVAPQMIRAGGGAIINPGSRVARLGLPAGALYSSAKAAAETLTRARAAGSSPLASASTRSRQGSSCRRTEIPAPSTPARRSRAAPPAGAPGHPAAIAATAVYLASDEATFVHGAVLDIDGGRANVLTSTDAAAVRPQRIPQRVRDAEDAQQGTSRASRVRGQSGTVRPGQIRALPGKTSKTGCPSCSSATLKRRPRKLLIFLNGRRLSFAGCGRQLRGTRRASSRWSMA
jgi:NAD(P)-dependent dehydrogenase (short-subunit alcohol dehydrogenase family)